MNIKPLRFALLGVGALLLVGCSNPPAQQAAPAPEAAPAATPAPIVPKTSINAMMVALVDHASHNLWNVEKEGMAPKTDADWAVVEEHAVQLVAAGPAITAGGTGEKDAGWANAPTWRAHAQAMSNAGAAALTAAQGKNLSALVEANGRLVESCESCHKEFKPDLPTEGIVHGHTH